MTRTPDPSNLRYGFDNWIYGMVGYCGFRRRGRRRISTTFAPGFMRFRPDGSKLEFLRSTNNNSWGVGISEDGQLFGSTANGCPSVWLRHRQPLLRIGARLVAGDRWKASRPGTVITP